MSIASLCILIAGLLPILSTALAKFGGRYLPGVSTYDNHQPRVWATQLTGWPQRAYAAQQNGFEALPLFIAGVLLAQQAHADQAQINSLAVAFVVCRVCYISCYVMDWPRLRSLVWTLGMACSITLLTMA
jgi:uncharacterized MAPEG superfamily protein